MGMQLAEAWVLINGDSSGLKSSFASAKRMAASAGTGVAKAFRDAAKITVGVGVAGGGAAFGLAKLASDAAESESKFRVVFSGIADEARGFSDNLAASIGRSKNDMAGFLAEIGDIAKPMGLSTKEALEFSKQVVALGADLASFNNESDSTAIERLKSALIGNGETVRAYGVILSESTLNAELLARGIEGGSRAASEQEKMLARLSIIQKGSVDAMGDAARTSGSFANQLKSLQANAKDFGIELGQKVLPIAGEFVGWLKNALPVVREFISANESQIKTWISLGAKMGGAVVAIGGIITAFGLLASPLGIVVGLALAAAAAFLSFGGTASELDNMLSGFGEGLITQIEKIMDAVSDLQDFLARKLTENPALAKLFGADVKGVEAGQQKIEKMKADSFRVINEQRVAAGKKPFTREEFEARDKSGNVQASTIGESLDEMQDGKRFRNGGRKGLKEQFSQIAGKFKFETPKFEIPKEISQRPALTENVGTGPFESNMFRNFKVKERPADAVAAFGDHNQNIFANLPKQKLDKNGIPLDMIAVNRHAEQRGDTFVGVDDKKKKGTKGSSAAGFSGVAELSKSIQGNLGGAGSQDPSTKASQKTAKNTELTNKKIDALIGKFPQPAVLA